MIRLASIIITIVVISACQQESNSRYRYVPYVDTTVINTVFLDFRFGMSESEFIKHINNLVSNETLNHDSKGYYFIMSFDDHELTKAKAYILNPGYYSDKLYNLRVRLEPEGFLSDTRMMKLNLTVLLMKKYEGIFKKKTQLYGTDPDLLITKGNLEVSVVEGMDYILLTYSDNRVSSKIEKDEKIKKKNTFKKSREAI